MSTVSLYLPRAISTAFRGSLLARRSALRLFDAKGERMSSFRPKISHDTEKRLTRMRQARRLAVHQPKATRDFQLRDFNLHQIAARQFRLHREAGHQRHAIAEHHEALDRLQTGQLHTH